MAKGDARSDRVTSAIRWSARIWSLPILVYAVLMLAGFTWSWLTTGVADPHAVEDYPFIENLPPVFMLLSVLGLGIAWRWERLGGTIAIVFQLAVLFLLLFLTPITRDFPIETRLKSIVQLLYHHREIIRIHHIHTSSLFKGFQEAP